MTTVGMAGALGVVVVDRSDTSRVVAGRGAAKPPLSPRRQPGCRGGHSPAGWPRGTMKAQRRGDGPPAGTPAGTPDGGGDDGTGCARRADRARGVRRALWAE